MATLQAFFRTGHETGSSGEKELDAHLPTSRDPAQEVGRFGQDRFGTDDLASPVIEYLATSLVMFLSSIQESYEPAGIEK